MAAGYAHPLVISEIRIAHILGLLSATEKGATEPVFRPDQIYPLAEGLARALAQADANQEVAVRAFFVERNLGVFTSSYVTAFRSYARGDSLILEFFEIGERVERTSRDYSLRAYELPRELPDSALGVVIASSKALVCKLWQLS